eukprot:3441851-Rhodomonas_salina.1
MGFMCLSEASSATRLSSRRGSGNAGGCPSLGKNAWYAVSASAASTPRVAITALTAARRSGGRASRARRPGPRGALAARSRGVLPPRTPVRVHDAVVLRAPEVPWTRTGAPRGATPELHTTR